MDDTARKTGTLFVVATPIGNLEDISQRALRVLREVAWVAAEDTRHSRVLLQHHAISKPMRSYHEHNEAHRCQMIVSALLDGNDIALISDAGTPLINDPGYRLVRAAQDAGATVVAVPGPSAVIAALSVAGLPTDRFVFEGFLPTRGPARRERLTSLLTERRTMVFYESRHRIVESLSDMAETFGQCREAALARELTKRFETVRRATLGALSDWLREDDTLHRGEFVVVVGGATGKQNESPAAEQLLARLLEHLPVKDAARVVAEITGQSRNRLYQYALDLKKQS